MHPKLWNFDQNEKVENSWGKAIACIRRDHRASKSNQAEALLAYGSWKVLRIFEKYRNPDMIYYYFRRWQSSVTDRWFDTLTNSKELNHFGTVEWTRNQTITVLWVMFSETNGRVKICMDALLPYPIRMVSPMAKSGIMWGSLLDSNYNQKDALQSFEWWVL